MNTIVRMVVALLLAGGPAAAADRVLQLVSGVVVERDGDLSVTETIRVQTEGRDTDGLRYTFPNNYVYADRDGVRVDVSFNIQGVTRDGKPVAWSRWCR
jgi:predicted secreted protein